MRVATWSNSDFLFEQHHESGAFSCVSYPKWWVILNQQVNSWMLVLKAQSGYLSSKNILLFCLYMKSLVLIFMGDSVNSVWDPNQSLHIIEFKKATF